MLDYLSFKNNEHILEFLAVRGGRRHLVADHDSDLTGITYEEASITFFMCLIGVVWLSLILRAVSFPMVSSTTELRK
jgi:hypothetical protein